LIERGEFTQGDQLPPERELAQKLNVSQATLRASLTVMQMTGISGQPLWLTLMRHSSFSTPNRWQKSVHEHRGIFDAICDHNSELAASSVQAQLRRVERIMVQ
jgi:DNA-binding FadR family transcriptional regulator